MNPMSCDISPSLAWQFSVITVLSSQAYLAVFSFLTIVYHKNAIHTFFSFEHLKVLTKGEIAAERLGELMWLSGWEFWLWTPSESSFLALGPSASPYMILRKWLPMALLCFFSSTDWGEMFCFLFWPCKSFPLMEESLELNTGTLPNCITSPKSSAFC